MKIRKTFWLDGKYEAEGGIFWRGFDLVRFIERVELEKGEIVGIAIESDSDNPEKYSANVEFIIKSLRQTNRENEGA